MNRAFIFDMDGVLINSESYWAQFEEEFFQKIFGKRISKEIGHVPGRGVDKIYELAVALGATVDKERYMRGFEVVAMRVYDKAPLTPGIDELASVLVAHWFKIGLVTQSRHSWIDRVVPRLSFKDSVESIISTSERPDIDNKPSPDGFLAVLDELDADAKSSIVLEDSNPGIIAAKAADIYTIGYRGNLVPEYKQTGADAYADTMDDVIALVEKIHSTV